ncbi:MAG: hypothetical protein JXR83_10680 [Deltaproteobacteria bacterium]|nr:hypothetical protein [Deltaproteobacteria bacterium]
MQIRRPSGPTRGAKAGGAGKARGAKGVRGTEFAQMVGRAGEVESTEALVRHMRSALLDELMGVAKELAQGKQDKSETTKRFVKAVIRDRFKGLKGHGIKRMEESVTDLIERDEEMAQKIHSQLLRLAKS